MEYFLSKIAAQLVLPPAGPLLLGLLGLLCLGWARRFGVWCLALGLGSLAILSLPVVALSMGRSLQLYPALSAANLQDVEAGAIVVLGGGRYERAPEYGGRDTVSTTALARLRYAAKLHRDTGLPVLVSGGSVHPEDRRPEADLMAEVLRDEFSVPVRWRERRSFNTAENALFTADMLSTEGVPHALLVTDSSHMQRSVKMFARTGLDVTPAPTRLFITDSGQPWSVRDFIPQSWALDLSRRALHEYVGMAWYAVRYR